MPDDDALRFLRTVFGLARRRATGVLDVASGEQRARLAFSRGRLLFVEHKSLGATLGAYLVTRGVMSRAKYQELAEQVRVRTDRSAMLAFVESAVMAGALDVEQASSILSGQVERNYVELFTWERFDCRFTADESVEQGPRFPCDLEAMTLQGIRGRFDAPAVRRHLAAREDMFPRLAGSAADLVRVFRLQPQELAAARALDGTRSLRALFEAKTLDSKATAHVVLALVLAQQIEWSNGRGERARDDTPAGVPVAAIPLRRVTPTSVRLTLPAPPSAAEIEAASAFRSGVAAFRAGNLIAASEQLARATAEVKHPEYLLYQAWVAHEVAGYPRTDEAFALLAEAARRALEHDATLAFGYFVVGHLHLMQNDALNAELAFRRAAKLDPTDGRAEDEADRLRGARHGRPAP